jgi:hypothetical protein
MKETIMNEGTAVYKTYKTTRHYDVRLTDTAVQTASQGSNDISE